MGLEISSDAFISLIQDNGIIAVFMLMVMEEIAFFIPSSIISISASAILVQSDNLIPAILEMTYKIIIPSAIAITTSSYVIFAAGYYTGKPFIERYGGYLSIEWQDIQYLEHYLDHKKENHFLGVFRAVPLFPLTTVSAAAGVFRYDWKDYGKWTFYGVFVRISFYSLIGWYFRDSYILVATKLSNATSTAATITLVLLTITAIYLKAGNYFEQKLKESNPNY